MAYDTNNDLPIPVSPSITMVKLLIDFFVNTAARLDDVLFLVLGDPPSTSGPSDEDKEDVVFSEGWSVVSEFVAESWKRRARMMVCSSSLPTINSERFGAGTGVTIEDWRLGCDLSLFAELGRRGRRWLALFIDSKGW